MSIWSKILGGGDIISEGFKLIDSIHTSDEEEIQAKTDQKVAIMQSYAPFKLAQRVLAFMFAGTFLFSFFLVLGLTLAGKGNTDQVLEVLNMFYIGEIMLTIVIFYFGGGFAEGSINTFRNRGGITRKPAQTG